MAVGTLIHRMTDINEESSLFSELRKQSTGNRTKVKQKHAESEAAATHYKTLGVRATLTKYTLASNRGYALQATLSLVCPVMFRHNTPCCSAALVLSATIQFIMPVSWATIIHRSVCIPNALRSSRRHPINTFSSHRAKIAPPKSSPNITHFGRVMSSMRTANPSNRSRLLRNDTSILSLPVFTRISR